MAIQKLTPAIIVHSFSFSNFDEILVVQRVSKVFYRAVEPTMQVTPHLQLEQVGRAVVNRAPLWANYYIQKYAVHRHTLDVNGTIDSDPALKEPEDRVPLVVEVTRQMVKIAHLKHQYKDVLFTLFSLGQTFNPNTQDFFGYTALHYAVKAQDEETIATLIKGGADPNLVNVHGKTPLHYCRDATAYHALVAKGGDETLASKDVKKDPTETPKKNEDITPAMVLQKITHVNRPDMPARKRLRF